MVTRDDVPHERRLPEPIAITVEEVDAKPKHPRDVELIATDENGDRLHIVIWKTHGIDQQWAEGQKYELDNARGKRYTTHTGTRIELHSTRAFQARETNQAEVTQLFIIGDTHVGYRHRARAEKPDWARNVNGRDIFARCLTRAREADVDAVIHVGDVFDHHNTKSDRNQVRQEINRTVQSGIPFYYVYGNHDDKRGRRLLDSASGIHLTRDGTLVGEQSVNLLGIDHSGSKFPSEAPEASIDLLLHPNILVIHETPYPVIGDQGTVLYRGDGNKADISDFIEEAHYGVDFVITGHLHVANQARVRGYDIPVLVTGPTIPISTYENNSRPSSWLLTFSQDGHELDRQPL